MKHMIVITFSILCLSLSIGAQDERPFIHASDVVFMYAAHPVSQYDDYQGTVVGWGGRPSTRSPQDVERFAEQVSQAQKRGMRYCGSVDFLVDFAGYIDFAPENFMEAVCSDLDANPLQVPWLFDHKHKGHPSYWFCFNNPGYQRYLIDQAERACLVPIDGLHIDDYGGTSNCSEYNGGCFCTYCMEGFREFLKTSFPNTQLQEWGIASIDTFHYGNFLKSKGFSANDYKQYRKDDPLRTHFQEFQNQQMIKRISSIYECAERLREKPLVRSVNSSASSPRTIIPSPVIDYFCGEIHHDADSRRIGNEPVFVYRMVEALGDRQTATASGQDWAWIKANEKPGMVRTWIAQAYAFGSVFMVPHNQWCYTQELGTHWWHGKPEDFAFLYRFVRSKAHLLDGYVSLSNLLVLCSNADFSSVKKMTENLVESNIPFELIYTKEPSNIPERLDTLKKDGSSILTTPEFRNKAAWLPSSGLPAIEWNGIDTIPNQLKPVIAGDAKEKILLSLRSNPSQSNAPIACHVLNQDYNADSDSLNPIPKTAIELPKTLFDKAQKSTISKAIIHEPQKESRTVDVKTTDSAISFEIENLNLWAIVELE